MRRLGRKWVLMGALKERGCGESELGKMLSSSSDWILILIDRALTSLRTAGRGREAPIRLGIGLGLG